MANGARQSPWRWATAEELDSICVPENQRALWDARQPDKQFPAKIQVRLLRDTGGLDNKCRCVCGSVLSQNNGYWASVPNHFKHTKAHTKDVGIHAYLESGGIKVKPATRALQQDVRTLVSGDNHMFLERKRKEQLARTMKAAWMADAHVPFNLVENVLFRAWHHLGFGFEPESRNTNRADQMKLAKRVLSRMKAMVSDMAGYTLTTDEWTAVGNESFCVVTLNGVSAGTFEVSRLVLSLSPMPPNHGAKELGDALRLAIAAFDIETWKIVSIVTDAAKAQKNAVQDVMRSLCGDGMLWQHCLGHVLALSFNKPHGADSHKSLLKLLNWAASVASFFARSPGAALALKQKVLEARAAATVVMCSDTEVRQFMGVALIKYQATRWNAQLYMLQRLLLLLPFVIETLEFLKRNGNQRAAMQLDLARSVEQNRGMAEDFVHIMEQMNTVVLAAQSDHLGSGAGYYPGVMKVIRIEPIYMKIIKDGGAEKEVEAEVQPAVANYLSDVKKELVNQVPGFTGWAFDKNLRTKKKWEKYSFEFAVPNLHKPSLIALLLTPSLSKKSFQMMGFDAERAAEDAVIEIGKKLFQNGRVATVAGGVTAAQALAPEAATSKLQRPGAPAPPAKRRKCHNASAVILQIQSDDESDDDDMMPADDDDDAPKSATDELRAELRKYMDHRDKYKRMELADVWRTLNKPKKYPHLARVAEFVLAHTPSSAASERAFSLAGLLKNKLRASLGGETLDKQMMIAANKPVVNSLLLDDLRGCGQHGTATVLETSEDQLLAYAGVLMSEREESTMLPDDTKYYNLSGEQLCEFDQGPNGGDDDAFPYQVVEVARSELHLANDAMVDELDAILRR